MPSNNSKRRGIVKHAVSEGITDIAVIQQWIAAEGISPATDEWIASFVQRTIDERRRESLPKVYCDGCWSRSGGSGIGVVSEDLEIAISERTTSRTVNVAEAEAVIRAIEAVREKGVRGVRFFSDSQLVVNWTSGSYACRSETARTLVPRIRQLLEKVEGFLEWIPGRNNPADKLSREAVGEIIDETLSPLEVVVRTPMEALRFCHFVDLRSGRDQYSAIRLPKLKDEVEDSDLEAVVAEFADDEKRQASCLRWILRGLSIEKAIRKVRVDAEITENVVAAKRRRRKDENS